MKAIHKNTLALLAAIATLMVAGACRDEWSGHYGLNGYTATGNIMQILESNSELSSFCQAVKAGGLDTLLSTDQTFTVWAPDNNAMAAFAAGSNLKEHFLENHINRFIYNSSDLTDTAVVRIKMLNGKFQDYARTPSGYSFAGIGLKAGSHAAVNGLVHTLGQAAPFYLNIYEKVNSNGYSTDSLSAYLRGFDEYIFDKSASTAVGKNPLGQLVYDSVFVYQNKWMDKYGDLYLEDSLYTVVVPTDAGWNQGYAQVSKYFRTFGTCESSALSNINVPTRTYAVGDRLADSLMHAYTIQNMAANIVFRGKADLYNAGGDSLTATSGNVFHHPARLIAGAVRETASNGIVWKTDTWAFRPEDCFLKQIVVEAEDTRNRTDAYANVFSRSASGTAYADSVSGQRYIEVMAATTNSRTQPMVQFTIPNTLAAAYDIYVVFAPAEAYVADAAADSTRVRFFLNYVHEDGKMQEDAAIAGTITHGKGMTRMHVGRFTFPFANFSASEFSGTSSQDTDCVKLRVQANVAASETTKLSRTMRIDCIILEPVIE